MAKMSIHKNILLQDNTLPPLDLCLASLSGMRVDENIRGPRVTSRGGTEHSNRVLWSEGPRVMTGHAGKKAKDKVPLLFDEMHSYRQIQAISIS